jgi:hypothetical protein
VSTALKKEFFLLQTMRPLGENYCNWERKRLCIGLLRRWGNFGNLFKINFQNPLTNSSKCDIIYTVKKEMRKSK